MARKRLALASLAIVLVLSFGIVGCSSDSGEDADPGPAVETPDSGEAGSDSGAADDARALVETKCSMCHSTDRVFSASKSREEWVVTIDRMKANGLVVTAEEYDAIVEYLSNQ